MIFFSFELSAACQFGAVCSLDAGVGFHLTGFEQTVQRAYFLQKM
jgi:hypothetical protein